MTGTRRLKIRTTGTPGRTALRTNTFIPTGGATSAISVTTITMMPNMMPKVGQGVRNRVFCNPGHGHLGWTLSPVTAEVVSDTVVASIVVNGRSGRQISKPSEARSAKAA